MIAAAWAYLAAVAVMSVVTFVAYGLDKRRARHKAWRVPESTLHLMELFGGWPGALFAQQVFRHKTRKASYLVVFYAIVLLHAALIGWWVYSVLTT